MEDYRIRKKDLIPIAGYVDYVFRNYDSLIAHNTNGFEEKAIPRALSLAAYHFMVLPAIVFGSLAGLEKLLS